MAEKLALSLDDLIAQASKGKDKRGKPPPRVAADRPAPQSGPRKGLKKNKPEQPKQQPQQQPQQQQQRVRQQQKQQQPQQQQAQQQKAPRAPKQLSGQRKSGAANLGVRGGQVQKRTVLEVPAKVLRAQPPLPAPAPQRRASYQQRQPAPEGKWQHDMYEDDYAPPRRAPIVQQPGTSTKLIIRNLHHQVTSDDLLELFSTCGIVKSHAVNYDNSGRSVGTGYVVFETRAEAVKAKKEYNGVMLDKQPMEIVFADEDTAGKTITKLSSGISVLKPAAAAAAAAGGNKRAGEGRGNGGQRLAAAALRETAAPSRGPRGGSLGMRSGRLRSAVVGRAQLDSDLQDYMQE